MLFPRQRTSIIVAATILLTTTGSLFGQNSEYERRLAAMQEARGRASNAYDEFNSENTYRVAANPNMPRKQPATAQRIRSANSPAPRQEASQQPMARQPMPRQPMSREVMASQPTRSSGQYDRIARMPQNVARPGQMRVAQLHDQPMVGGGAPVMDDGVYEGVVDGGEYYEESMGCDDCGGCGSECGYFQNDACCSDGSCPPGDCWLQGLGGLLTRGDYFFGAQGFQSPMYRHPGTDRELEQDCNFGFYGGFNWGMPLCRLSCGLFAGQFGVRSVHTNLGGNEFTLDKREQTFMTAGLFRRVDYGVQGGVVADILWDDWYTRSNLVQLRSDIGYLWGGGTSFGFRYHTNLNEDQGSGIINGQTIDNIFTTTVDSYRFYLRHEACTGGYGELFAGWSESDQSILGGEIDAPITECLATQAGVTYYLDDTLPPTTSNRLGGYVNEAWNIYAGFSYRPCGRSYYRNYDRPFFNVADNGSMLIRRR